MSKYELYLVTDENFKLQKIEQAILGGVTMVQLREKNLSSRDLYHKALEIQKLTEAYDIPLIINDRLDIAIAIGAQGVHLGQKDLPISVVRQMVGDQMILGASTATLSEAIEAQGQGADYLGVGAMYPTKTKSHTRPVTLETLKSIVEEVTIPVVAIGGINKENLEGIRDTGVDGVAVVSEILKSNFPKLKAEALKYILNHKGGKV